MNHRHIYQLSCLALLVMPLLGCEQIGIETPAQATARQEAEGKAIGSACRQAGRALEDCYQINVKASKAAIFTGWREMDAYMRENKLEIVQPLIPPKMPTPKRKKEGEDGAKEGNADGDKEGGNAHSDASDTDKPAIKPASSSVDTALKRT